MSDKLTEDQGSARLDSLRERIPEIVSAKDMPKFMEELLAAWDDGVFEPQDVTEYLNGVWGVIEGNAGVDEDEEAVEPSWRFFAEILFRAFAHS